MIMAVVGLLDSFSFADVKEGDVYEAFKMEEYRD